ncbi:alpha-tocopherol transfer protein-like [Bombyx mori]|uniref:CRAL-TRIO domain-containing protein n=1 Tax=Bombyx mori TaxID=7091 RepID=A0A8R2R146_BOMMO|nr:alpha-tocopherol transfer protein-like [Bombyx mori]
MAFLQGPSLKQAEVIKQELGEGPGDLERGVRDLQNMLAATPYLPEPETVDKHLLELFVRGCRMDLDRARSKLEAFCIARKRHRDLYEYISLNEPPLNDVCKFCDIATLPKLTDEGLRITVFIIKPGYPESSADVTAAVRATLLLSDARMKDETLITGDVFIYEVSKVRGSLVARVAAAAGAIRRGIQLAQAAYPQRLKRIHVVGAPTFLASSLQLMRNCVNEKIKRRYYLHAKVEELFEHFPARVIPEEWGGEEESVEALVKKWRCRIDESRDFLRNLNEMGASTANASVPDTDIYGTVGAFRKLEID